jgi:signal transduction histidine kinase
MIAPALAPAAERDGSFSLERRLLLRLGILYVFAMVIVSAIYLVLAASSRHLHVGEDVDPVATAVGGAIHSGPDGRAVLTLGPALQRAVAMAGGAGFSVVDRATGQNLVSSSNSMTSSSMVPVVPPGNDADYFIRGRDGNTLYRAVREVNTPAGRFQIYFTQRIKSSAQARAWIMHELGDETFSVLVPLLVATILVSWLTLRASLRSLRRIAEEAERIAGGTTDVRLDPRGAPREILPLLVAANGALDRVETALREQQRLMANIAHELRTPLAILRARIESLNMPSVEHILLPDFDRVSKLVSRLLAVARLQSEQIAFDQRYDVVRVTRECLAQMAPVALMQKKELVLDASDAPIFVRGNPAALTDAVRNLVDNALRYTDAGQAVEIAVSRGCSVEVRDHGPGVPAGMEQRIFEPFWRGEESSSGAGLGLAIATVTAKRHAGQLRVRNAPDGGAIFRIELPQIA